MAVAKSLWSGCATCKALIRAGVDVVGHLVVARLLLHMSMLLVAVEVWWQSPVAWMWLGNVTKINLGAMATVWTMVDIHHHLWVRNLRLGHGSVGIGPLNSIERLDWSVEGWWRDRMEMLALGYETCVTFDW